MWAVMVDVQGKVLEIERYGQALSEKPTWTLFTMAEGDIRLVYRSNEQFAMTCMEDAKKTMICLASRRPLPNVVEGYIAPDGAVVIEGEESPFRDTRPEDAEIGRLVREMKGMLRPGDYLGIQQCGIIDGNGYDIGYGDTLLDALRAAKEEMEEGDE